jgi:hypothetical protein
MTPPGIARETFQLVAHCLNQLCHRVPVLLIKPGRNNHDGCHFSFKDWCCNTGNILKHSTLSRRFVLNPCNIKSLQFLLTNSVSYIRAFRPNFIKHRLWLPAKGIILINKYESLLVLAVNTQEVNNWYARSDESLIVKKCLIFYQPECSNCFRQCQVSSTNCVDP